MSSTMRLMPACLFFVILSGCIVFPTKGGEDEPFTEETLSFIEVGKSTKEDILAAMPHLYPTRFLGGEWWLYMETRFEGEWFVGIGNDGKGFSSYDYRYLLISFDENGVVTDFDTSQSEKLVGCNQSGVCGLHHTQMLLASTEQDRAVKLLDIPKNRCGIFIYGRPSAVIYLHLDGHQIGGLLDKKHFVFEESYQGAHKLAVTGPIFDQPPVDFTCRSGSSVYLQISMERPGVLVGLYKIEVTVTDALQGRRAIDQRHLMLHADN